MIFPNKPRNVEETGCEWPEFTDDLDFFDMENEITIKSDIIEWPKAFTEAYRVYCQQYMIRNGDYGLS